MSFRINTNVTALNALRNLNATTESESTSITRLSTGLRINSGADDPSGLIASEKYKAQITGLTQAINNSQDGVNYAKTADGALSEVSNLLNSARGLAVAAANSGSLSSSQLAADQSQLKSITDSITRIAQNTQFGTKKLLDGSAGVSATITDSSKLASLNIGGTFSASAVTANSGVGVQVTQAAKRAMQTSATFATAATAIGTADSMSINGVTFSFSATDTAQGVVDAVNKAQGQTGVSASYDATNTKIVFTSTKYGSTQNINLTDSGGTVMGAAGYTTTKGTDALATLTINGKTALFTGSQGGNDGLSLSDADGNSLRLTEGGNAVAANTVLGQVTAGSSTFQIGSMANQTASLSLTNFASSQLGTGVASGVNLSNLDLTTSSGATQAIQVIDAAIDQITSARGQIGSFQSNVLQSNIRSLGTSSENLSAANSTISDTDIASEMTSFTKAQILQSSGISVLAQANSMPQAVLKLL